MNSKRIRVIDISKGLGILCVLLGHRTGGGLHNYIYLFHMPLFFILSGFVMNDDKRIGSENKLLSSYIVYSFIYIIISSFFIYKNNYDFVEACLETISFYGIDELWFLSSLWLSKICIKKILNKRFIKYPAFSIIALYIFAYSISLYLKNIEFLSVQQNFIKYIICSFVRVGIISIFVYLGFILKKYIIRMIIFIRSNTFLTLIISICLSLLLLPFIRLNVIDYHLLNNGLFIINILVGIVGSLLILCLSIIVEKIECLAYVVDFLGKHSMFIMASEYFLRPIYRIIKELLINYTNINHIFTVNITVNLLILMCLISTFSSLINNAISKLKRFLDEFI